MSTEAIITAPFRLAFPEVFEPKAGAEGGKEKYSITMLFPADGEALIPSMPGNGLVEIRKLALAAIKEKFGEDKTKWPAALKNIDPKTYISATGKDGWPLRDGNLVEWQGFEGNVFVRASSQFQPGLVDAKLKGIIDRGAVFGGLICRAQINAYAYDVSGNKGVTFGLSNLQILKDDGTVFAGKSNAADAFSAFTDATTSREPGEDDDAW